MGFRDEALAAPQARLDEAALAQLAGTAPSRMVVRSAAMARVLELALRIAPVEATVLITGESGTGKELIARLVHAASPRAAGPFIAVNCGAIAEPLLESELFGHGRGAFTGAVADRAGLFEAAGAGTLLLDELGEVSPAMQVKLLRVLQEREVRRVGENRARPVAARVIAATNCDLRAAMEAGRFRRDLFYRLDVVTLHLPPLRARREDILPLAEGFLRDAAARLRSPATTLAAPVRERLLAHAWPGNVRELENAMERAAALAEQALVTWVPLGACQPGPAGLPPGPARTLAAIEQDYILAVLAANGGNQLRTAEVLGIGSATLYRKLKRYGLVRTRWPRLTPPGPVPALRLCD